MTRTILVTGGAGFMGSALVAALLADGATRILSLAPDDDDAGKVRAAVRVALQGCALPIWLADRIAPVTADLRDTAQLAKLDLHGVDQVWHVAAHMSYAIEDFAATVDFNANAALSLLLQTRPAARFVFVSTTGVAGPGDRHSVGSVVPEDLLYSIDPLNPYTVSKHLAEHMLANAARERGIALTILRPGAIIGHSGTGWSNGTRFGYYSYLQAFRRYLGRTAAIDVDIAPERIFPVIHIDHLVRACAAVAARDGGPPFEVFHLANQALLSVRAHFDLFEEVTGNRLKIGYGPGQSGANRAFNKLNADNNRFMGTTHRFATGALEAALGAACVPPPLALSGLRNVFAHYLADHAEPGA
jgi:nucleoside-diphosphate-sugar epimerase